MRRKRGRAEEQGGLKETKATVSVVGGGRDTALALGPDGLNVCSL